MKALRTIGLTLAAVVALTMAVMIVPAQADTGTYLTAQEQPPPLLLAIAPQDAALKIFNWVSFEQAGTGATRHSAVAAIAIRSAAPEGARERSPHRGFT